MEKNNIQLQNIFGNHLIGDKIVSYLTLEDVKTASLVSLLLYQVARNCKQFSECKALHLTGNKALIVDISKSEELQFILSSSWKMVEFDTTISAKILKFLGKNFEFLENIQALRLTQNSRIKNEEKTDDRKILLRKIFSNCHKIVELQIDFQLLMTQDFFCFLKPDLCAGIKTLEIFSSRYYYSKNSDKRNVALRNLQHLASTPMNLEHIKVGRFDFSGCDILSSRFIDLISSNMGTLQSLNLKSGSIWQSWVRNRMDNIRLPNLLHFVQVEDIESSGNIAEFVNFLENQPPLKTLRTVFEHKCPTSFLCYLAKKGHSLEKLSLTMCSLQTPVDWQFLGNCSSLKEFTIIRKKRSYSGPGEMKATGVSFLTWLPSSLTKLCIRGLNHFWKDPDNLGGNISESQIVSLLSRFPSMTKLDLIGCNGGAVSNLVVQTVIAKMPKLRELKFSHGSCTDFALTGIKDGVVIGVSLTQLTGLTHLAINSCIGISANALVHSVNHSFLQSLEYLNSEQMTPDQVEQLVTQNPLLTRLSLRVKGNEDSVTELKSKFTHSRLWKQLNLDYKPTQF